MHAVVTAEVIQPLRQTRITVADKALHCSRRTEAGCRKRGGTRFKNSAGTAQSVNQIRYSAASQTGDNSADSGKV